MFHATLQKSLLIADLNRWCAPSADQLADGESGVMVALQGTDIVRVPINDAVSELKRVPLERYAEAEVFFG